MRHALVADADAAGREVDEAVNAGAPSASDPTADTKADSMGTGTADSASAPTTAGGVAVVDETEEVGCRVTEDAAETVEEAEAGATT